MKPTAWLLVTSLLLSTLLDAPVLYAVSTPGTTVYGTTLTWNASGTCSGTPTCTPKGSFTFQGRSTFYFSVSGGVVSGSPEGQASYTIDQGGCAGTLGFSFTGSTTGSVDSDGAANILVKLEVSSLNTATGSAYYGNSTSGQCEPVTVDTAAPGLPPGTTVLQASATGTISGVGDAISGPISSPIVPSSGELSLTINSISQSTAPYPTTSSTQVSVTTTQESTNAATLCSLDYAQGNVQISNAGSPTGVSAPGTPIGTGSQIQSGNGGEGSISCYDSTTLAKFSSRTNLEWFNVISTPSIQAQPVSQDSCPPGYALFSSSCIECPPGSTLVVYPQAPGAPLCAEYQGNGVEEIALPPLPALITLFLSGNPDVKATLLLIQGLLWIHETTAPIQPVIYVTPSVVMRTDGTEFSVQANATSTVIIMISGSATIYDRVNNQTATMLAGQELAVTNSTSSESLQTYVKAYSPSAAQEWWTSVPLQAPPSGASDVTTALAGFAIIGALIALPILLVVRMRRNRNRERVQTASSSAAAGRDAEAKTRVAFCTNCGSHLAATDSFCAKCGTRR